MKLRGILLVLSLLVILTTVTGGVFYYFSLNDAALHEAHSQAFARTKMIVGQVDSYLSENMKPVRALAGLEEVRLALASPDERSLEEANGILDHFQEALDVEVCYLMDSNGVTVASSNRRAPDSFLGQDFSFRPYFQDAMGRIPAIYMALGTTSQKRGVYYSHPVTGGADHQTLGVVVIKAPISVIETKYIQATDGEVLLTDPHGVVFSASRPQWLFSTLSPLSPEQVVAVQASRQFGSGPLQWAGFEPVQPNMLEDADGREYLMYSMELETYPKWRITYLRNLDAVSHGVFAPFFQRTGVVIFALFLLTGSSVFYLYRKASFDIVKRREVEEQLRQSKEQYRRLYHHTPAMLHSIDHSNRFVSVSDYWLEALGYGRDEVVGRELTDFMTDESRRHAIENVLPGFFATGFCKDVPYQFVKKNGERMDVLLSAILEKEPNSRSNRSLAVLVDITQRKRAEEELRQAKEQLSYYSKDLERQVEARTREITSILMHTPAVVYMKDRKGRYLMVNSRFEEVFHVRGEEILGKTVYDLFSGETAERLKDNEQRAIQNGTSTQVEEHILHGEEPHSYLTVIFPIRIEKGRVEKICGIAVDITDLKKAQDQLRRLSGNIMSSYEQERAAIARELHDELGQVLTALRMDAVWLKSRVGEGDHKSMKRVEAMCSLIDNTISDVRNIATRLRPVILDDLGLFDALEWYTTDFEKRTGIACSFTTDGVPDKMDQLISTAAYRIAQEALTNVARHARASQVDVSLSLNSDSLVLIVRDDGQGFSPSEDMGPGGLGLLGMRERAGLLGGVLVIASVPGRGAEVRCTFPFLHPHTENPGRA
ncbi:MAG: PAS domain S-box protein [Desulfovibrionales bacterium]